MLELTIYAAYKMYLWGIYDAQGQFREFDKDEINNVLKYIKKLIHYYI